MIRRQIIEHSIYSVESGRLHNASQLIGAHLNERDAVIYPQLEGAEPTELPCQWGPPLGAANELGAAFFFPTNNAAAFDIKGSGSSFYRLK